MQALCDCLEIFGLKLNVKKTVFRYWRSAASDGSAMVEVTIGKYQSG